MSLTMCVFVGPISKRKLRVNVNSCKDLRETQTHQRPRNRCRKNQCAPDGFHTNFWLKRSTSEAGRVTTSSWSKPLVSFFSTAITSHHNLERCSDRKELLERSPDTQVDNIHPFEQHAILN